MNRPDPETIYLEPICKTCEPNGRDGPREWCADDVWSGECDGCGQQLEAVEYTRARN